MLHQSLEGLPTQVETVELRIAPLKIRDDPQRLRIVIETAIGRHASVHHVLALMTEGGMAKVVGESQTLGEVLVQPQRAGKRARDLGDLDGMGQPCAEMIALVIDEHLRLVFQAPKRRRMNDPVAVALERGARRAFAFGKQASRAPVRVRRIGRARLGAVSKGGSHRLSVKLRPSRDVAATAIAGFMLLTQARPVHTYQVTSCTGMTLARHHFLCRLRRIHCRQQKPARMQDTAITPFGVNSEVWK